VRASRDVPLSLLALVALLPLALASFALGEPLLQKKTVTCSERITFRDWRTYKPPKTRRMVLGRIALRPQAETYLVQGDFDGSVRKYVKFGMAVRSAKGSVELTVPPEWRARFAIGWGFKPRGQFESIRFPSCARPPAWPVYSGGFYVLQPACVPLDVRVGTRTRRVLLGIGVQCP
jgi:hypothetical protein